VFAHRWKHARSQQAYEETGRLEEGELSFLLLGFTFKVQAKNGLVEDTGSESKPFYFARSWLSLNSSRSAREIFALRSRFLSVVIS
jgi:hypothetical protein